MIGINYQPQFPRRDVYHFGRVQEALMQDGVRMVASVFGPPYTLTTDYAGMQSSYCTL